MKLKENKEDLITFFKEIDYPKMLLRTIGLVSPIGVFYALGNVGFGLSMAFGVLMSSPSDISGSFRRRFISISISIFLAVFSTLIMGYTAKIPAIQVTVLCLLVFLYSLITVYGLRATLISFAGMFALLLSLSELPFAHSFQLHALLVGCGGLLYLLLSTVYHLFTPEREIDQYLEEIMHETAAYLRVRAQMIDASNAQRQKLDDELFVIHDALNEKHEKLREMLIYKRRQGKTTSGRRELLILVELVDIFELGMANAVTFDRLDELLVNHPQELIMLKQWSLDMSNHLSESFQSTSENSLTASKKISQLQINVKKALQKLEETQGSSVSESMFVLQRLYLFKEQQYEKIEAIDRVLRSKKQGKRLIKAKGGERLLPSGEYSFDELKNQLDFKSPIFRHSLRLTSIILVGYMIGLLLKDPKVHWILLTVFVIMRPGYALTKDRFKARLLGTLIGGAIAVVLVLLIDNRAVFGFLAFWTLMFSYPIVQKNHKVGAAIITMNFVFIFGLVATNPLEMIQHRTVDTFIGAALAFLGNSFLWPSWQYMNLDFFFKKAIVANKNYLSKTLSLYLYPESSLLDYKVARKEAFLEIADANAAFQRMSQEPKSKQKDYDYFYNLVALNQELLFSIASIGSFVRTHHVKDASGSFQEQMLISLQHLQTAEEAMGSVSEPITVESQIASPRGREEISKSTKSPKIVSAWFKKGLADYRDPPEFENNIEPEAKLLIDQVTWTQQVSKRLEKLVVEK